MWAMDMFMFLFYCAHHAKIIDGFKSMISKSCVDNLIFTTDAKKKYIKIPASFIHSFSWYAPVVIAC